MKIPTKWLPLWVPRINRQRFRELFFDIENLKQLQQHGEYDLREFYIFDDRKLVYLITSKVACTSIKMAIAPEYGIDVGAKTWEIHLRHLWNCQEGHLTTDKKTYYKFAFVRNPFDRLVSCYRDKVLRGGPREDDWGPHFHNYIFSIHTNLTFAQFVNRVVRIPDILADRHFKSQYFTLSRNGKLLVDYIGKFETLSQDWQFLAQQYGFSEELPHLNRSKKDKKDTSSDFRTYYTKELAQLVYKRYQQDVELFGYRDAYEDLLDFV